MSQRYESTSEKILSYSFPRGEPDVRPCGPCCWQPWHIPYHPYVICSLGIGPYLWDLGVGRNDCTDGHPDDVSCMAGILVSLCHVGLYGQHIPEVCHDCYALFCWAWTPL